MNVSFCNRTFKLQLGLGPEKPWCHHRLTFPSLPLPLPPSPPNSSRFDTVTQHCEGDKPFPCGAEWDYDVDDELASDDSDKDGRCPGTRVDYWRRAPRHRITEADCYEYLQGEY
jgi:hypothetical protein